MHPSPKRSSPAEDLNAFFAFFWPPNFIAMLLGGGRVATVIAMLITYAIAIPCFIAFQLLIAHLGERIFGG